jgi:hypothetical protein
MQAPVHGACVLDVRSEVVAPPLSIDIRGTWSPRQARAVIDAIADEARARGLSFRPIEVTTFGSPRRVLLQATCIRHGCVVDVGTACGCCLTEAAHRTATLQEDCAGFQIDQARRRPSTKTGW